MVNRFKYKYFFGIKKKHILILFPFLIIGGILTAEALIILFMNHGLFLYTLDDPYIHLALADHIMQGHYGINHVEASSPSSSMIWPILLAPWVPLVGSFAPILLNVITTIALIPVLGSYLDRIGLAVQGTSHSGIMVCGIIVMTNVIGLTFTGLEHVLQVFCAVLVVKGVVQELEAGYCASWFLAALVMGPLIRYESLAITVPVSLYCVVRGHGRLTLSACGVTLSMLFAFSIFLHSLGLNWLPSSVLAKAVPVTQSSTIIGILGHLKEKLATPPALFLMTMVVGLGLAALQRGRNKAERSLAISGASSGLLHLFFGEFGWYHRYEI